MQRQTYHESLHNMTYTFYISLICNNSNNKSPDLKHWFQVVSNAERCFGLALDLINSNTIRNFYEGEAIGKVNIEDALDSRVLDMDLSGHGK